MFRILKTLRNNWKKTIFFSAFGVYGCHWVYVKYEESLIRREYCEIAKNFGSESLKWGEKVRKVTVFLNPAAYGGKGKKLFEKNAAPLLYLAGMEVNVVQTEHEGQAKAFMSVIDNTDAVVIAGGDGTLLEIVTGLLRRSEKENIPVVPIGVLPVGKTNSFSRHMFQGTSHDIRWILDSAMAIIEWKTKPVDVMHIKGDNEKDVYALTSLQWGPYRDAETIKPKFWYFGGLKTIWAYFRTTFGEWPKVKHAKLEYVSACDGCCKCRPNQKLTTQDWRWWHLFLSPRKASVIEKDYSSIENEDCGVIHEKDIATTELSVVSSNETDTNGIQINIGPQDVSAMEFIQEGWNRRHQYHPHKGSNTSRDDKLLVQEFSLNPAFSQDTENWFTIDNEKYEAMKVNVKLLKEKINVFCHTSSVKKAM